MEVCTKKKPLTRGGEVFRDSDLIDYYETPNDLREKVASLAQYVRESKHTIVYTGSWMHCHPLPTPSTEHLSEESSVQTASNNGTETLRQPTFGEMALAQLQKEGYIHSIITTNDDGMHLRTGIPPEKLLELYGNTILQKCVKCGSPTCDGHLLTHHIKDGDPIPETTLTELQYLSDKAELAIVFGTSMRDTPIARLPMLPYLRRGGRIVICHTKVTPFDMDACLRIFGAANDVLCLLAEDLKIEVSREIPEKNIFLLSEHQVEMEKYEKLANMPKQDEGLNTQNFRKMLREAGKNYLPWTCNCGFVNESYPSICEKCEVKNPGYGAAARTVDSVGVEGAREFLAELLTWGRQ